MIMFNLESVQPDAETIAKNQSKVGDADPCVVCGKKVNALKSKWVHLSCYGNLYPAEITTEDAANFPEGTMFFFPVGPECAKKIPAEYIQKEG
ncbi:hypothetical protein SEA_ATUIN_284 [Arthrobacter phage Atuin]|nr:hypothetical protein SEA_ATUIN_83 [Arthrobacter phage Atuin]